MHICFKCRTKIQKDQARWTGLFRIFMPKQLPADNCRQTTTTAEKSNYQKGKPDYPADDSTIYAKLF